MTSVDPLLVGYLSQSFTPRMADFYYAQCLLKTRDVRALQPFTSVHGWEGGIFTTQQPIPNAQPVAVVNGHHLWLLDYTVIQNLGTVVQQTLWRPSTEQEWQQLVARAHLEMPMFFVHNNGSLGVSVANAVAGNCLTLRGVNGSVQIGDRPSIRMRIYWAGYNAWEKRLNTQTMPVSLQRFVGHVGRSVRDFMQEHNNAPCGRQEWRIGGHGGITPEDVVIIGVVQVSQGSWQPILQLSRHIMYIATPPLYHTSPV